MTWLYFVYLAGGGDEENVAVQATMALGKLVQFAFPVVYLWYVDRSRLGWPAFHLRGFWPALGFGALTALALFGLYYGVLRDEILAGKAPAAIWEKLVELNCATPARYVMLAAFISVAHALLEEYYWRWFVFGRLRQRIGVWPAVIIASLGFMAHHIIVLWVYFPGQFWRLALPFSMCVAVGGAIWCLLYERSRSLWGIWLSHLIVDAAILAVGYDMVQRWLVPGT
jgi:membrane protease YdiL (CAAX protease family)